MRLTITYNKEKNGIELAFIPKLSDTVLENYLIELGFKKSNSKGGIWYVTDRPSYKNYVKNLQEAFNSEIDPNTIKIAPSYDVDKNHIDHYQFSLVNIKTDADKDEDKGIDYVIFDDLKKTATDIATRFAKAKYGSKLSSVSVSPRNFKRRARNAFDEGRIITGVSETKEITTETEKASKETPKWLKTKEAYFLDNAVSEELLKDEEYIDEIANEHEQLLIGKLAEGIEVPNWVLEGYPRLNRIDDFQYSYETTDFESSANFLRILKTIDNQGEYYTAKYIDDKGNEIAYDPKSTRQFAYDDSKLAHAYVWIGKDVKIGTVRNPLLTNGKAGRIGIEGKRTVVVKLITQINKMLKHEGITGLYFIEFSKLSLSEIPYSYTSYTNEKKIYTKDHAGDRFEMITVPFPLKIKIDAIIRLVQDEGDQYLFGLKVTNTLSKWSGYSFAPMMGDDTYPTKEEALQAAVEHILGGVQYDHTEALRMGASEALKKAYKETILAIYSFAESKNIELSEEKSKAILPLSGDEEESKKKEDEEGKTLNTLNEDVEWIVDELRELETDVDDKGIAFNIGNAKIELDEILQSSKGELLIIRLKENYTALVGLAESMPKGEFRDRLVEISDRFGVRIGAIPKETTGEFDFRIVQEHTTLDTKQLGLFQAFIELHKNALHISYLKSEKDGSLRIREVKISSDRDTVSFLYTKENNTLKIDGINPHDEGLVYYHGEAIPMEKLKKAINYMLANPQTLRIRPAEVHRLSDDKRAVSTAIEHAGKNIPNVLIPEGVDPAFDFGKIKEKSKNELKEEFPALFKIQEDQLIYAIPSQLFILFQLSDLDQLGLSVRKSVLKSHWLQHGDRLFELLGYPTDMDYPYVDLNLGYYQIVTLKEIIKVNANKKHAWWRVVDRYRPIADLEKAIQFINEKLKSLQEEFDALKIGEESILPVTERVTKERYEKQRKKVQDYLDTYGNPYGINKDQKEIESSSSEDSKPKESESGVYVAEITNYKTVTPNVLIPRGVIAPFDSGSLSISDAKEIQRIAPHLLAVTDGNLIDQTAKTMFELSQMPHPEDYGFSVTRSALLQEWQRRGKLLFEDLSYPTDLDYPYVNIHTGYRSVSPLGNLIDIEREGNQWWSVVEHNRPIANMETALAFIDKEIESYSKIRDTYTNPKTGKPKNKKEYKEQYQSLTFVIERFENSKLVIIHYLDLKKDTVNHEDIVQKEVSIEDIHKEDQDYFSNIMVPQRDIAPFDKGYIAPEEAVKLKEQFFYLFEYTYRNMHWASPVELFMLLQFTHLKESGISVKKETLYRIWEKEGQSLFNQLGYPTDPKYPYIHLEKGFFEILPLEVIVSTLPDKTIWWSAVKHYRPIANVSRALKTIIELQNSLTKKFENFSKDENDSDQKASESNEEFLSLSSDVTMLRHSRNHLEAYLKSANNATEELSNSKAETLSTEDYLLIPKEEADRIRRQFRAKGFKVSFTGKEVFNKNLTVVTITMRHGYHKIQLEKKLEKEYHKWIEILEKEVQKLEGKTDQKSKQSREHRMERISALRIEAEDLTKLVAAENNVFRDELFLGFIERAKAQGYVIGSGDIADFRSYMITHLLKGRMVENYPDEPISKVVYLLIDDYFSEKENETAQPTLRESDYLDKVIAIMHDHYINNKRLTKKGVEALLKEADVPNMGMLWEAVELSWLLWYKMLYGQPGSFEIRLQSMIQFWNTLQPTYAYSDSSKEQYKQYSTSCPISAMIAEYTKMSEATSIFEPSAGNGLLVLGADPAKTHVNEIDNSRRKSLEFQKFKTITHLNASEPFPEEYTKSFDVVVTNPPFDKWGADKFDKDRLVKKYFDGNVGLNNHLRLEHLMSGLALHTMKDSGKAALIIKGHIKFREDDGYMATYKPFFNWLYSRYVVDDVINMNSYNLYNKQGAVTEMMLILIGGRKPKKSKRVAPNRNQAASLADIANTFETLWQRIVSHIKTPLAIEIEKLKIALGYDIF